MPKHGPESLVGYLKKIHGLVRSKDTKSIKSINATKTVDEIVCVCKFLCTYLCACIHGSKWYYPTNVLSWERCVADVFKLNITLLHSAIYCNIATPRPSLQTGKPHLYVMRAMEAAWSDLPLPRSMGVRVWVWMQLLEMILPTVNLCV